MPSFAGQGKEYPSAFSSSSACGKGPDGIEAYMCKALCARAWPHTSLLCVDLVIRLAPLCDHS
nr:MAG TPA: hypothetical protein [Caudoviricetes sp.]